MKLGSMKSSTLAEKLSLSKLISNLKNLNEESDQSREQGSNPVFADESIHIISPSTKDSMMKNVDQRGGITLGQICRKKAESNWAYTNEPTGISQLKQTNRKLYEDNRTLMKQCIRLRMLLENKNIQYGQERDYCELNNVQLINMEYLNQIHKLKTENMELRLIQFIPICSEQQIKELEALGKCIEEIRKENVKLSIKIEDLMEKDKNNKLSRSNTTTSRTDNNEMDKIIKNIKVVYESQIKTLKDQIQVQKEEIMRLSRFNRPGRQQSHQSPPKTKPI